MTYIIFENCYCGYKWMHAYDSFFYSLLQYSLLHKKDNAHDDSIWSVAWGKVVRREEPEKENGEGENHDENSRYKNCFFTFLANLFKWN